MSKLFRAFTEMIEGNSKTVRNKAHESETLKKSEFKTLLQQELSPGKTTCKYKHIKHLHDSDAELMNEKELTVHLHGSQSWGMNGKEGLPNPTRRT